MPNLDDKLNEFYPGRVVRKDLLHSVKKGTNVPSFVIEFLLAKYCASDEPDEIEAGKLAVIETLEQNFVRPPLLTAFPGGEQRLNEDATLTRRIV